MFIYGFSVSGQKFGKLRFNELNLVFGATGKQFSFGSFGHKNDQFKSPRYVTTSPDNHFYVSDHHNHCVKVFDEEGNFKFKFGAKGRGDGEMSFPEGIAFLDWANGILIADEGNNRVCKFDQRFVILYQIGRLIRGLLED